MTTKEPEIPAGFRAMTPQEVAQYIDGNKGFAGWQNVLDYARKWYGPSAHRVEVEVGSEYNDEGGYDPSLESLTVYTAEGTEIGFDFTLPSWVEAVEDSYIFRRWVGHERVDDDDRPAKVAAFLDVLQAASGRPENDSWGFTVRAGGECIEPYDLNGGDRYALEGGLPEPGSYTYTADNPPPLSIKRVYVREDGE